jgi:hypothetical protein
MAKQEQIQIVFAGGINENIKQDINVEAGKAPTSLLWLENYNPNLEFESLVKRFGIRPLMDYLSLRQYSRNLFEASLGIDTFTLLKNLVKHSTVIHTINPISNETHLFFLSRVPFGSERDYLPAGHPLLDSGDLHEATALVSHTVEYRTETEKMAMWTEPFMANATSQLPVMEFPGWYVFGTFQDACKYGESIIYVTKLMGIKNNLGEYIDFNGKKIDADYYDSVNNRKEICNYMYPCYLWKRWDITKARDDDRAAYWNGLELDNQDPDGKLSARQYFSRWKTMKPSMSLIREKEFGVAYIDDAKKVIDLTTGLESKRKVALVIWEESLFDNPYFYDKFASDSKKTTYPVWEGIFANQIHAITSYNIVTTIEELNNERLVSGLIERSDMFMNIPQIFTTAPYQLIPKLEYPDGKAVRYQHRNRAGDAFKCVIYGEEEKDRATGYAETMYKAVTFGLPDYLSLGIPRCWLQGDKIPILLTAKINGIEVIVAEEIYTVRKELILNPTTTYPYNVEQMDLMWLASYDNGTAVPNGTVDRVTDPALPVAKHARVCGILPSNPPEPWEYASLNDYTVLYFSLKLDPDYIIDADIESIQVYVARPLTTEPGLFNHIGVYNPMTQPPQGLYAKPFLPRKEDKDYSKYGLIKTFVIKGKGEPQYSWHYKHYDFFKNGPARTNAWGKLDIAENSIWALPQEDNNPEVAADENRFPYVRNIMPDNTFSVSPIDVNNAHNGTNGEFDPEKTWTPDFMLWDYPLNTPPLNLQSNGKYWEGLGARLCIVVQGRTILGGCINKEGEEEQGLIRPSAVQGAAISPDVFNELDKLKVGHLPHTAVVEFREQMIWFNRQANYRIITPRIGQMATWEFLDAQQGQGTFSQKTVCVTPQGVVYGNESGIWISDGRKAESMSESRNNEMSITSLWQKLSTNKPYLFLQQTDPGEVYVNEEGYNSYLEFVYDEGNNELNIITPVSRKAQKIVDPWAEILQADSGLSINLNLDTELRLIYSFSANNWRVETYDLFDDYTAGTITHPNGMAIAVKTYSDNHKVHYSRNKLFTSRMYYSPYSLDSISDIQYEIAVPDNQLLYDHYLYENNVAMSQRKNIIGSLVTHEYGNGRDDYHLDRVILELIPKDSDAFRAGWDQYVYQLYNTSKEINENIIDGSDPMLWLELRNIQWTESKYFNMLKRFKTYLINLIETNFLTKIGQYNQTNPDLTGATNPFLSPLQTPGGILSEEGYTNSVLQQTTPANESMVLLSPFHTKFRHARFMFISEIVAKIKSISVSIVEFRRRSY